MDNTTTPAARVSLGIDVAKAKLDACLLTPDGKTRHKRFANTPDGFAQLLAWAKQLAGDCRCHFALEATSCYSDALATFLADAGERVSL